MESKSDYNIQYKKGVINPVLIIILVVTFIFGVVYFLFGNKNNTSKVTIKAAYTEEDLTQAQTDVGIASADLNNLIQISNAQWPVVGQIRDQYTKVSDVVTQKTDILFKNPESQNPEIKIKVSSTDLQNDINTKRRQITESLNQWENTINIINSSTQNNTPTLIALVETAKQDIAEVKTYVQELKDILATVTPENSDLSQAQINAYKKSVDEATKEINSAVSEIVVIESNIKTPDPTPVNNPTEPPPATQPIVTPAEIKVQQEVVAEAEQQVIVIQEQINQTASTTQQTVTPPVDNQPQNPESVAQPIQYVDFSWPDQDSTLTPEIPKPIQGTGNI